MEHKRKQLLVLYGSETGNAMEISERIGRDAKLRGLPARVVSMDCYDTDKLSTEDVVVFIVSTCGQGDPPASMREFWKLLLRKSLPADWLSRLKYTVYGLGDSGYLHYNVVAKKLDRRLFTLGATPCLERELGDDQHPFGFEATLEPWLQRLWSTLAEHYGLSASLPSTGPIGSLEPKYRVTYLQRVAGAAAEGNRFLRAVQAARAFDSLRAGGADLSTDDQPGTSQNHSEGPPLVLARLKKNERVTSADHFRDVRHIEFDVSGAQASYSPGDILCVLPAQPQHAVEAFMRRLHLDPAASVRVELTEDPAAGAIEVQLGPLLEGVADLASATPSRYFYEVLRDSAADEVERQRLDYFLSPQGRSDFLQYNRYEKRTVLEALQDFPSAQPPLAALLGCLPRLRPRQFSIASSPRAHPNEVHILAAVVAYATPSKRPKRGLCTSWLASLQAPPPPAADFIAAAGAEDGAAESGAAAAHGGVENRGGEPQAEVAEVPIWLQSGLLHLPPAAEAPLVMVAAGTGIAPFRSFLEERHHCRGAQAGPPSYLYFGCRGRELDFFYREQWEQYTASGLLAPEGGLQCAFSRDAERKVYVQHKMKQDLELLWRLLNEGAYIYVSGSAEKMPQAVEDVLTEAVQVHGNFSKSDAQRVIRQLKALGRYVVEAWS